MNVIHFLLPKVIRMNTHGMLRGLPKPALAILPCLVLELFSKYLWQMTYSIVQQLSPREFTHIIQGAFQPLGPELYVE